MPFPTTWFTLHYVDTSGGCGSYCAACAHTQERRGIRSCLRGGRAVDHSSHREVLCGDLSCLLKTTLAPPSKASKDGCDTGQCTLASRQKYSAVAEKVSKIFATRLSASIQSRSQFHRARVEVNAPPSHTQSLLPGSWGTCGIGIRSVRILVQTQRNLTSLMRSYLRRHV